MIIRSNLPPAPEKLRQKAQTLRPPSSTSCDLLTSKFECACAHSNRCSQSCVLDFEPFGTTSKSLLHIIFFLTFNFLLTFCLRAETNSVTTEEQKLDALKFNELKEIIKKDKLAKEAKIILEKKALLKKTRKQAEDNRFFYPNNPDYWQMMSEMWLVKNAVKLKWEFEKSDLGIGMAFKKVLEDLGIRNLHVRLLLLNSYEIPHISLPSKDNEIIFLLSLPFVREMDLSKVEISLLLVEDYWRWKEKIVIAQIDQSGGKEYEKFVGKTFNPKKIDLAFVQKTQSGITDFVFNTGLTFEQQFKVTAQMKSLLNTNKIYYKAYESLLKKRQDIIVKQPKFSDYSKRYPSPEMQIKWFSQ